MGGRQRRGGTYADRRPRKNFEARKRTAQTLRMTQTSHRTHQEVPQHREAAPVDAAAVAATAMACLVPLFSIQTLPASSQASSDGDRTSLPVR